MHGSMLAAAAFKVPDGLAEDAKMDPVIDPQRVRNQPFDYY